MIYLYISIAVLLIIILYPIWIKLWVKLFGKNVSYETYKDMTVIYCDNFFCQGIFIGWLGAVVRPLYYTDNGVLTKIICWTVTAIQFAKGFRGTTDIKQHEIDGHGDQYKRYCQKYGKIFGWLFWEAWAIGNYSELPFIAHDSLPIERQAEAAETFTN